MLSVRVKYKKTGRARFISHLDMNRLASRIIRKSRIPVWFTEGYSPHIYVTFALPLQLGFESICEYMDFRLDGEMSFDEIKNRLDSSLPEGVRVISVSEPVHKPTAIVAATYDITPGLDDADTQRLCDYLSRDTIEIEKKTKKGVSTVNIAEQILSCKGLKNGIIRVKLAAGGGSNLSPLLMYEAVRRDLLPDFDPVKTLRTALFDADGNEFI